MLETWKFIAFHNVIVQFNTIVKIHKHNKVHEKYHFISMIVEVRSVFGHDMDQFIRRVFIFFKIAYSKALIIIRSHDLYASDIGKAMGEIVSYHKKDSLSAFFGSCRLCIFWPFFGLPFVFYVMVLTISFYWNFYPTLHFWKDN